VIAADKETYVTLATCMRRRRSGGCGLHCHGGAGGAQGAGAILIAVLGVTAVGILLGISPFGGVVSLPPSLGPTFLALDLKGSLSLGASPSSWPSSSSTCSIRPAP